MRKMIVTCGVRVTAYWSGAASFTNINDTLDVCMYHNPTGSRHSHGHVREIMTLHQAEGTCDCLQKYQMNMLAFGEANVGARESEKN